MFGVVASVQLRLSPRRKVQRIVEEQDIESVMRAFDARIADGFLYGDFQFSIDSASDGFLRKGVFSCYKPVSDDTPMPAAQAELKPEDWMKLLYLAHADKEQVYRAVCRLLPLAPRGRCTGPTSISSSFYPDNYHQALDPMLKMPPGTEMITELYVPRAKLADFMLAAREELRRRKENVIYGTVRLIERDDESFLAWAKQPYACVIFNLHVEHSEAGQARAADSFRALIDLAAERDGSYYLTYHRWARRDQVERCYPRFASFLRREEAFRSAAAFPERLVSALRGDVRIMTIHEPMTLATDYLLTIAAAVFAIRLWRTNRHVGAGVSLHRGGLVLRRHAITASGRSWRR